MDKKLIRKIIELEKEINRLKARQADIYDATTLITAINQLAVRVAALEQIVNSLQE